LVLVVPPFSLVPFEQAVALVQQFFSKTVQPFPLPVPLVVPPLVDRQACYFESLPSFQVHLVFPI
jgi:hypothetical protein